MAENKYPLVFEFIAKTKGFVKDLDISQNKIKSFGNQMTKTGRMLSTRLSAPLVLLGGVAIKQAANFERLQTTLNTLTGSAEEGAAAFEKLVQFSAKTPFQLDELVKVNNTLMGFGLNANEAFDSLSMLGDISGIVGGDLQSIGIAFGQAAAEGRVMTRDLRQFINNGVPILDILAESMGVARGEIMDMASEGKITFDILNTAFKDATSEGGKFAGGMNTLSQTLNGLFSTLKDNVNIALAELGQEIADALNLKEGIPALSKKIGELTGDFKNLDPETQKFILFITGAMVVVPPLIIVLGQLAIAFGAISAAVTTITPLIAGVTAGVASLAIVFGDAALKGISFGETLKNLILSTGNITKFATLQGHAEATANALARINDPRNAQAFGPLAQGLNRSGSIIPFAPGFTPTVSPTSTTTSTIETEGDKIKDFIFGTTDIFTNFGDAILDTSNLYNKEFPKMTDVTNGFSASMENMSQKFTDFKENTIIPVVESTKSFGQVLQTLGDQIIPTIGQALIDSFANINEAEDPLKRLGKTLEALVTRLLAAAAAAALLAIILTGGTGTGFLSTANKIFKSLTNLDLGLGEPMARGGIVSGPTTALIGEYPGARSNPEVVAPLNKLKSMISGGSMQGEFVLRGQDLVVALQRAEKSRNRII